jgi:methylase of polypeptide subunit release factors
VQLFSHAGFAVVWQAAWEVDSAAETVHSPIFDAAGKVMDPQGDARLRASYNDVMVPQLKRPVKDVLDMGCATGLSTLALRRAFPDANITGVDLSPFFLVCASRTRMGETREEEAAR